MIHIISLIGAMGTFLSLIILGPESRITRWLYPVSALTLITTEAVRQNWIGLIVGALFYAIIYFLFVKKKTK